MKRAFVTGATGFIGSHLVDELLKKGFSVKCSIRKTSNLQWLVNKDIELVEVDLSDKVAMKKAISGCDYIFHLAGVLFAQSEEEYIAGNVGFTKSLIDACSELETKIKRFVYLSSIVAAGSSSSKEPMDENCECAPFTWYGKSKLESEQLFVKHSEEIPFTIIRPGAVFGPRDSAMLLNFKLCRLGINLVLGECGKLGSVIHIHDLINGIIQAAESEKTVNEIYFLANDKNIKQEDFGKIIIEVMGKRSKNIVLSYKLVKLIVYICDFFGNLFNFTVLLNKQKFIELSKPFIICTSKKAKEDFNFKQSVTVKEGVKSTFLWYKENKWL